MRIFSQIFGVLGAGSGDGVLSPVYGGLTLMGPIAVGIVLLLSLFYGVFLGVKFARAKDETERAGAQKTLVNFIIGAGIVVVLIAILYAVREPLAALIDGA